MVYFTTKLSVRFFLHFIKQPNKKAGYIKQIILDILFGIKIYTNITKSKDEISKLFRIKKNLMVEGMLKQLIIILMLQMLFFLPIKV